MKKSTLAQDQERMSLFQNQLKEMNQDYEFMKRNKEEAKKILEARFQDIERKIQGSRDFIAAESKRITDTLVAFKHKFQHQLKATKSEFDTKIATSKQESEQRFKKVDLETKTLQEQLDQERSQRMGQFQQNSKNITQKIQRLAQLVDLEKTGRQEKQTFLLGKINEQVFKIHQTMKAQKDDRNLKVKEVREYTVYQIQSQTKFNEDAHKRNLQQFSHALKVLESEMNTRFSNKDQIINSLSKVVKTLQSSFRHVQ